jgi:hypothetical protein
MNKEFLHMQKLAGLITEGQYTKSIIILEDETIDEGLKDWIIKGLIVLTTLGGIGKVYQMDQKAKEDRKAQIEYYDNVLSKEVSKMSDNDLFNLGAEINSKTKALQYSSNQDISQEDLKSAIIDYANKYIKAHPNKFAVGVDGGIYQIGK